MEINKDEPFKALKEQVMEYIELRTELARLSLIEHAAKVAGFLFAAIVSIIIIALVLLSVFIAMSFFIGECLHSYGLGFLISAGVYLLVLWYFQAIGSKKLQAFISNRIVELTDNLNNNE